MTALKYKMTYDALFKLYFVKNPEYLKRVVGMMLNIPLDDISYFTIINAEIPPEELSDKFCRLDINMTVNGQRVDLEIQVEIKFWLAFFAAQTEEELNRIMEKGVPVMKEAVSAYKSVSVSSEFYEIERLRDRTRHNEASAIGYAKREAAKAAREKRDAELKRNLRALGMTDDFIAKALTGGV